MADPPEARTAVPLENLVAIFHAPSGMTHLLAPPAPEILDALTQGPADIDLILIRLMQHHDLGEGNARAAVAARLDELEASGLVRRA